MGKTFRILPPIKGDVFSLRKLMENEDLLRLIDHDSMKVYYDVRVSGNGQFSIAELSTTTARSEIILPTIKEIIDQLDGDVTVLDLACSPGYFMFKIADLGVKQIIGVDARKDHLSQFTLLNSFYNYKNIRFIYSDLYDFLEKEISAGRKYDICLLFGFLYHTATPVELLRSIRKICKTCLIIDTTLNARHDVSLTVYEEKIDWSRASTSKISLNPSLRAVPKLLESAGFNVTERITPLSEYESDNPGGDNIDYYFDKGRTFKDPPSFLDRVLWVLKDELNVNLRGKPSPRAIFKALV